MYESAAFVKGNVVRDAEVRYAGNSPVCNFSVAVNRKWKGNDGKEQEKVSYVDVAVWGKYGETLAKSLTKGAHVAVFGELEQDRWEKDGKTQSKLYVKAAQVVIGQRAEKKTEDAYGSAPF